MFQPMFTELSSLAVVEKATDIASDTGRFIVELVNWVPSVVTFACTIFAIVFVRRFFGKRRTADSVGKAVYNTVQIGLAAIGTIAAILALPIASDSKAQLMSLLGLVLTGAIALSSTNFLGNALAGVMLRSWKNFRPGDILKVGDVFGRVSDLGLLHTEVQTETRNLTTIPNLYLVSNPVEVVRSSGTVVAATVSLGYDVDRVFIEKNLIQAAEKAGLQDPFIQITNLGDFSVTYRTAGFLEEVKFLLSARSQLMKQILDCLHQSGIEIVSPTFMNQRQIQGGTRFIPASRRTRITAEHELPEEKIFDKAEKAESKANLESEIVELEQKVEKIQKSKEPPPDISPQEAEKLAKELEQKKDALAEVEEVLKDNNEK